MIKAVAFDLEGNQLASASTKNVYTTGPQGLATQVQQQTWSHCSQTLTNLGKKVEHLAARTAAVGVTGQGDGTWLIGKNNKPAGDAWLWLDARATNTVQKICTSPLEANRFKTTGTGLSACQQGPQIAHMAASNSDVLAAAEVALHCKDWLYLNLTGVRATDPSEASFSYGDFRTRCYDDSVIEALGLTEYRYLLPPIVDGSQTTHPLSSSAAASTGLLEGTPVSLGFVDMICTALGAGVHTGSSGVACSTIGSTGMHMQAVLSDAVKLNNQGTGYIIPLPVADMVAQTQSNMSATLNIDWALNLASDLMSSMGSSVTPADLVKHIEHWLSSTRPASVLFHPYISTAGERGPFVDTNARAGLIGLNTEHRFADLMRAVVEGLGMATRDCYAAMSNMPCELRLSGGAGRSRALRSVIGACVGVPCSTSTREETGAAGAAMIAAVGIGVYPHMDDCIAQWVTPLLGELEEPDMALIEIYNQLYPAYREARVALQPTWDRLAHRPELQH